MRSIRGVCAALVALVVVLAGCGPTTQESVANRQAAVEQAVGPTDTRAYAEAIQMARIEQWKDDEQKIVNWYIFNAATGNLLIPPVRCIGTPISTTEDMEPGSGTPRSSASSYFLVPVDGVDILTQEVAGRDATYGDEVPAWECLTVEGQYIRIGMFTPNLVSSASFTFPPATVQRDLETEVRLEQAKAIIQRGGCVNAETLIEQPCAGEK
jgi:hypothetical protein